MWASTVRAHTLIVYRADKITARDILNEELDGDEYDDNDIIISEKRSYV